MNNFKRLLVAIMASAMISSTFVTGFAANIMARTPVYTIQMVGNTLTLMKNGVAFMPYRLSTVAGADAVKLYQTATGEVRISFVDSTGKTRLIEIGKEANLEVKGTFPSLVIDKSVINTAVTLATHNKNDRNAIPTIIRDLQVNGAITLQIPVGAEVQKATVSNKDTKVDIAQGSDVKNVTVADGVVVGGTGSSDANVSTDTSLGGTTSGGSTSGGSTSGGSGSSGGSNSGGSNSGDDESDNEPAAKKYTVKFVNGEGKIDPQTVTEGQLAKKPEDPTSTDKTMVFLGWFEKDATEPWDFAADKVKENTTLTAKFGKDATAPVLLSVTMTVGEKDIASEGTTLTVGQTSEVVSEILATLSEEVSFVTNSADGHIINIAKKDEKDEKAESTKYGTFEINAENPRMLDITLVSDANALQEKGTYILTLPENLLKDKAGNTNKPLILTVIVEEDETAPLLESVTLTLEGAEEAQTIPEGGTLVVAQDTGFAEDSKITILMSENVKLAVQEEAVKSDEEPTGTIFISGKFGQDKKVTEKYGTFVVDTEDSKKLIVTLADAAGPFTIAGDYTLFIKAGALKDVAGVKNIEHSIEIKVNAKEETKPVEPAKASAPEVAPETSPEIAPETSPEVAPETSPEVAPETSPEVAPETSPEVAPETSAPEVTPETSPEVAPATSTPATE